MRSKRYKIIEQDGERFNPVPFQSITEEKAHARYCKASKYKKGTISAVWKIANRFSVKSKEIPKVEKPEKAD